MFSLITPVYLLRVKHGVRQMRKKKNDEVIINCASIMSLIGEPTGFAYCASKGAVISMTQSLALQYAKDDIRCAAIAPAHIESGMVS